MTNYKYKTSVKLISIILIQLFLFSGSIYSESVSNKNISSIYINDMSLRVPISSIDNDYSRMQKALKQSSDINIISNMKDMNSKDIILSFNLALNHSMEIYLENEIQWQKDRLDIVEIPKKGDLSILLFEDMEANFLSAAIAPRVGRTEIGGNVKLINHTMLKESARFKMDLDIDKLNFARVILFFDIRTKKITECAIVPNLNQDKNGQVKEYLKVIELILSICKGSRYANEELNKIKLTSSSMTLFDSEELKSIAYKERSSIFYYAVDFYNFYAGKNIKQSLTNNIDTILQSSASITNSM